MSMTTKKNIYTICSSLVFTRRLQVGEIVELTARDKRKNETIVGGSRGFDALRRSLNRVGEFYSV